MHVCHAGKFKLILCGVFDATKAVESLQEHGFKAYQAGKPTAMVFFTVWIDSIVCKAQERLQSAAASRRA